MKTQRTSSFIFLFCFTTFQFTTTDEALGNACPSKWDMGQFGIEFIEPGVQATSNHSKYMDKESSGREAMKRFGYTPLKDIMLKMKEDNALTDGIILEVGPFHNPLAPTIISEKNQWVIVDVDKQATIENVNTYSKEGSRPPVGVVLDINGLSQPRYRKLLLGLKKRLNGTQKNLEIGTVILSSVLNYVDAELMLNTTFQMLKPGGLMFIGNANTGSGEYHKKGMMMDNKGAIEQFIKKFENEIFLEFAESDGSKHFFAIRKLPGQVEKNLASHLGKNVNFLKDRSADPFYHDDKVPEKNDSWSPGNYFFDYVESKLNSFKVMKDSLDFGRPKLPREVVRKKYPEALEFFDYPHETIQKILENRDERYLLRLLESKGTDYRLVFILKMFAKSCGWTLNRVEFEKVVWLKSLAQRGASPEIDMKQILELYREDEYQFNTPMLAHYYGRLPSKERKLATKYANYPSFIFFALRFGDLGLLKTLPQLLTDQSYYDQRHIKSQLFKIAEHAAKIADPRTRWKYATTSTIETLKARAMPTSRFLELVNKLDSIAARMGLP